jgi:hypothetical protein
VSCASAGNCSAAGSYIPQYPSTGADQGLLVGQTGGSWAAEVFATLPAGGH